jgi:hypothetical protein
MGDGQCENPLLRWQVTQIPAIIEEYLIRVVTIVGVNTEDNYILHQFQIRKSPTCPGKMSGIFTNWPGRQGRKGLNLPLLSLPVGVFVCVDLQFQWLIGVSVCLAA